MGFYEKWLDKVWGIFFSKDRTKFYLLLIILLGFVLRLVGAINLGVSADDMHFSVHAIEFLSSGKLVVYDQSASLWYAVTDIFYNIFGASQLGSRMAALLFGSLSIIAIFFLTREFSDTKAALVASLLLAISPFHIKYTVSEMDVMAMFFVLMSMTVFFKAIKTGKAIHFASSGIVLGLALMTKVYTLLFVPVLVVYALYHNKSINKQALTKSHLKLLTIFIICAGIFAIPSLTHNYLLYKEKGIMDLIYTNALGTKAGEGKGIMGTILSPIIDTEKLFSNGAPHYSWDTGFGHGADWRGFFLGNSMHLGGDPRPSSIYAFTFIWNNDPIILLAGILGIIFLVYRKQKAYPILSILVLVLVFAYLASRILLAKHYIFLLLLFIPPAGIFLSEMHGLISKKIRAFRLRYIIMILLLFSLFWLGYKTPYAMSPFYIQSEVGQLMNYKEQSIPDKAFVFADSRIYRGQIHWALNGKTYAEAAYLPQIVEASQKSGRAVQTETYFIECAVDDCGWGTIKDQPQFNQSMENIVEIFSTQGKLQKEILSTSFEPSYFPGISKPKTVHFKVYKTTIPIDPSISHSLDSSKVWFLYPIGYDEDIAIPFDKYYVDNPLDSLIDLIAHAIQYLAIILAFITALLAVKWLLDE
ncbi:glycosyltransferase family 39 protein [Candidatus Pacearchaeota archaeon]|nr:glycosyltransferase family 39 protein [Candidatus Pacearchaeota archaeon]